MADAVNSHAGVTVEISDLPQDNDLSLLAFSSLAYTPVGNVGNLGEYGINTNMLTYDTTDTIVSRKAKGITNAGDPTIEVARDDADLGQIAMRAASLPDYVQAHAFKITKQNGTVDYLRGLVAGPASPSGRNEDFDLHVFTLGLLQAPVTDGSAPVMASRYNLNGTDMFLQIPEFTCSGNPDKYLAVSCGSDSNDLSNLVDASGPITQIGRNGASFMSGTMYNVSVHDSGPLIKDGDRPIAVGAPQLVSIPLVEFTGSWKISFVWRRVDATGSSTSRLMGRASPADRFEVYDSGHGTTPNRFTMIHNGTPRHFDGAFDNVDQGEDCLVEMIVHRRVGANLQNIQLRVDGDLIDELSIPTGSAFGVDSICDVGGLAPINAFSSIANVKFEFIEHSTSLFTIFYPMDEGAGFACQAYDKFGADYNSKDGTYSGTTLWATATNDSRLYTMDTAGTDSIPDALGGANATIQNYNAANWIDVPMFSSVAHPTVALNHVSAGAAVWNLRQHPNNANWMYAAAASDGLYPIDITNPAVPVPGARVRFKDVAGLDISMSVTDALCIGDVLYICGRTIQWGPTAQPGIVAAYDISGANASSPVWLCSFEAEDMNPLPALKDRLPGQEESNAWFQGMATNAAGSHLFLATQRFGVYSLDLSDVTVGNTFIEADTYRNNPLSQRYLAYWGRHNGGAGDTVLTDTNQSWTVDDLIGCRVINLTGSFDMVVDEVGDGNTATTVTGTLETGAALDWQVNDEYIILRDKNFYWECSQAAYDDANDRIILASHGNGLMTLDASDPTALADPILHGPHLTPEIGGPGTIQLRMRDVFVDDRGLPFVYAVPNTTTGNDDIERGIMIHNIRAAGVPDPGFRDYFYAPIAAADNHVRDDTADEPYLGGYKFMNHAYIGIGSVGKGLGVFDVSNPTNPVYVGAIGENVPSNSLFYSPLIIEKGGSYWAYFADAIELTQKHNLYIEELTSP